MGPFNTNFTLDKNTGDFGSLGNLQALQTSINDQFALIDASNNVGLSIAYIDGSMVTKAYMVKADASIALKVDKTYMVKTDASISAMIAYDLVQDTSLAGLTTRHNFTEASLGTGVNSVLSRHNFTEASVGQNIRFRTDLGVGLKDASGNIRDLVAIDSSLYFKVGATSWMIWTAPVRALG